MGKVISILMVWSVMAFSGTLDEAYKAHNSGDYTRAVELFENACEQNIAPGCFNLGIMYYKGRGIQKDYAKSAKFLEKTCALEGKVGCYILGTMYTKGEGVKKDFTQAKAFFKKACELGLRDGCENYKTLQQR